MSLRKKAGWDELERMAGIKRTESARPTTADAQRIERRILGRTWGRARAKGSPPK